MKNSLNSLDQLARLWNLDPAVFTDVLLSRVGRIYSTEDIGLLKIVQVLLIHHRKGRRQVLGEIAVKGVML